MIAGEQFHLAVGGLAGLQHGFLGAPVIRVVIVVHRQTSARYVEREADPITFTARGGGGYNII